MVDALVPFRMSLVPVLITTVRTLAAVMMDRSGGLSADGGAGPPRTGGSRLPLAFEPLSPSDSTPYGTLPPLAAARAVARSAAVVAPTPLAFSALMVWSP